MEDRIVETMRELGFTATQARVYLGLLKQQPATGYELARRAEVPRSAIYNVLGQLEGLGLVNAVQERPAKYAALPPERLLDLLQSRFSGRLEALKDRLDGLQPAPTSPSIWTVQGYHALLEQARTLVDGSAQRVVASLWGREARQLSSALRRAAQRGVELVLFSFTPLPRLPGQSFSYGIPERELERYWPHKLIMAVDGQRLLVGSAEESDENRAVVTEEAPLVEMALNNLVLDLTLYGERVGAATDEAVRSLTSHLAPIEELVAAAVANGS